MTQPHSGKVVRIGGACGFWGESSVATPQLLAAGGLDYLVYDYLAEITMSIMARARAARPEMGYATDFVTAVIQPNLAEIAHQGVKIISNAGGVNPLACAAAIRSLIRAQGLDLRVAVISGDDLIDQAEMLASSPIREMFSATAFPAPASIASINAYLGAFPIAQALQAGADIIITGRGVDSATTLGACIHEFGWAPADFDALAGGSLAGHILECGPQATGGNFTDWELVADSLFNIGYPIAEIAADGSFICTKPAGSGGLVSAHTVGEQMLYEIGDPQAYVLPDVVCDFSAVELEQVAEHRVRVSGARGRTAPSTYKVSATYADGFRGAHAFVYYGFDAGRKARRFAAVALERARAALQRAGLADFSATQVELIGDESHYGARRAISGSREVMVKVAAKHAEQKALHLLFREMTGMALGAPPGLTGFAGTRPKPSPVVRLFSFELPKDRVEIRVEVDGHEMMVHEPVSPQPASGATNSGPATLVRPPAPAAPSDNADRVEVPLIKLALARSGDKGNKANIGVIARRPEYLPYIWAALSESAVADTFAHFLEGAVERFLLPGTCSINFLLHDVLGGGGMASLRNDPQGKGYSQLLLNHPIAIPRTLAERLP